MPGQRGARCDSMVLQLENGQGVLPTDALGLLSALRGVGKALEYFLVPIPHAAGEMLESAGDMLYQCCIDVSRLVRRIVAAVWAPSLGRQR